MMGAEEKNMAKKLHCPASRNKDSSRHHAERKGPTFGSILKTFIFLLPCVMCNLCVISSLLGNKKGSSER